MSRYPSNWGIKEGYPLKIVTLALFAGLAWERLQIDTYLLLIITSTVDELSGGTNIDDLEFFAIQAAIHISRVNCAETIPYRPGQRAYEMFTFKLRFNWCKAWPRTFKKFSVRVHWICVSLQNVRFLLCQPNLGRERLQIDTYLLHIIRSTADGLSGVWKSMTLNDLELQEQVFFGS